MPINCADQCQLYGGSPPCPDADQSCAPKLKSSTSCRICGHWIEGDYNNAPRGPEGDAQRAKALAEMDRGYCDQHPKDLSHAGH